MFVEIFTICVCTLILSGLAYFAHKRHIDAQLSIHAADIVHKEKNYHNLELDALIKRLDELEAGAARFVKSIEATNTSIASTQQMLNAIGINRGVQR